MRSESDNVSVYINMLKEIIGLLEDENYSRQQVIEKLTKDLDEAQTVRKDIDRTIARLYGARFRRETND